ncbi:MAG: 1,4-alpha-glucan branching protein GlgB [Clostridia bacterium]|nr:1,4-alpha-glucan branching protein GlgB [Clostridia bacterium]
MGKTQNNLDLPVYLFHQGNNSKAYEIMGSHKVPGTDQVVFRVWAPHATAVSVVGDFNDWDPYNLRMEKISDGIWEATAPDGAIEEYSAYKYAIEARDGRIIMKADPYGYHMETRPGTASKFYDIDDCYTWNDDEWLEHRASTRIYDMPVNIYEVHAGSWKVYEDGNLYSYRALADELVPYVADMGYTHIEFMPLSEYPFDGSWGYQVCGYYAATSRYGTPADLMYLIDKCHQNGIGVILDWVPAHFPKDAYGLFEFDGEPCYEYPDPRKGEHKTWGTKVFDFGKTEVQSFLVSNAHFWFDKYHIDGIRVDAVASMLYLNYDRKDGEWIPNANGGVENLEAVAFLQKLNESIFRERGDVMMIAEESTAWPNVSKPTSIGGLGFNFKWNMGWMNDVIRYFNLDGLSRKYNHDCLTFSFFYAFSENFVLPISHDEVVHGKGSLINKHPGDPSDPEQYAEKFAGVRSMLAYMYSHPGKKLLFMGSEFGQFSEWNYKSQLDWNLLDYDMHHKLQAYTRALNTFYKETPALWEIDYSWEGFEWIIPDDNANSVLAYKRKDQNGDVLYCLLNFTKVNREGYKMGCDDGVYEVVFDTDAPEFGGSGWSTGGKVESLDEPMHSQKACIALNIAGNSALFLKKVAEKDRTPKWSPEHSGSFAYPRT